MSDYKAAFIEANSGEEALAYLFKWWQEVPREYKVSVFPADDPRANQLGLLALYTVPGGDDRTCEVRWVGPSP